MNKKLKGTLAVILALAVAFAFASCSGEQKEDSDEAVTYEVTGDVLEADGKTMTIELDDDSTLTFNYEGVPVHDMGSGPEYGQIATVCYEGEPEGDDFSKCKLSYIVIQMGKEKKINGKLTALNDKASTLTINDGEKDLTFDVSKAERHYKDGIRIGNQIVIDYYGRINGTDTTYAHVTAVIDNDLNSEKHKETVTVKVVTQTVWTKEVVNVRAGSSTATEVVATLKKGTKLTRTGILSDGWSRIEYKGKDRYIFSDALTTKDPDKHPTTTTTATTTTTTAKPTTEPTTSTVTETTAEPTTETTTQTSTAPAGITSPLKGIITEFTADEQTTKITIKADDDTLFRFDVTNANIHLLDGHTVGAEVLVEFEGTIIDGDTSKVDVKSVSTLVKN